MGSTRFLAVQLRENWWCSDKEDGDDLREISSIILTYAQRYIETQDKGMSFDWFLVI